jgi:PAS domain S-box-containing protein
MIEERKFYWTLLDTLEEGVYFTDPKRKITYWNKAAERLTGFKSGEVLGKWCGDNILCHIDEQGNNLCEGDCPLARTLKTGQPNQMNIYLHHKEGHRVPVQVRVNPVFGLKDETIGAVEIFSDLSSGLSAVDSIGPAEEKGAEFTGPLTGLPNMQYLKTILSMKLFEWREFNHPFAVFSLSLDGLGDVETRHGRETVERLLGTCAETISHNLNPCDMVGEWQEGQFLGIVSRADEKKLQTSVEHYRVLLEKTYPPTAEPPINISLSVKHTMVRADDSIESLINRV